MSLNKKQKQFIRENYKESNVQTLSNSLSVDAVDVETYLKILLGDRKFKEYIESSKEFKNPISTVNTNQANLGGFISQLTINWMVILSIFLIAIFVYVNSLGNDFVSDDRSGILFEPTINNASYIYNAAPLAIVNNLRTFLLHELFGPNAWGYRLANVLTHALNAVFVFLLFNILKGKKFALFTALLFAVHPILVESITWIAGGIYSFYALWALASVYFYILADRTSKTDKEFFKNKYFYISIILFIIATITSEKAVAVGLFFILYEVVYNNFAKNYKRLVAMLTVTAIHVLILIFLIPQKLQILTDQYYSDNNTATNPLVQIPIAVTEYIKLIFYPINLSFYQTELSFTTVSYLYRLFLFVVFIAIALYAFYVSRGSMNKSLKFWEKADDNAPEKYFLSKYLDRSDYQIIVFGIFWFIIALSPTLTPFGVSWVVAERYAYLGTVGIFAIIALFFYKFSQNEKLRVGTYVIFSIVLILMAGRTIDRNMDWKNEDTLWIATLKTSPSGHQIHNNMGDYYARYMDYENAIREFQTSIDLKPGYSAGYHNLAVTYQKVGEQYLQQGKQDEAREQYNKAIESHLSAIQFKPDLWQSHFGLATIFAIYGQKVEADTYLQQAMKLNPNDLDFLYKASVLYYQIQEYDKSKQILLTIQPYLPNNPDISKLLIEIEKLKSAN